MSAGSGNIVTGALAELHAQAYYVKEGYEVFTPIIPQSKCDFIVAKGSEIKKVQVKKATDNPTASGTYLQVRLQGKPTPYGVRTYSLEDFDELFIVHPSGCWRIPSHVVIDKKSFTFGKLNEDGSVTSGKKSTVNTQTYKVQ